MLVFWSCIHPRSISTEGLNCSVSRSETTQHRPVVHWCEPPPHPALALSMKYFKLSDRSSQCSTSLPVYRSLSKTEGAEVGTANSITAQKCSRSYGPGSQVETSALSSLLFRSSPHCCFSFLSYFPPSACLFPSLHHLSAPPSPALLQCTGLPSQLS